MKTSSLLTTNLLYLISLFLLSTEFARAEMHQSENSNTGSHFEEKNRSPSVATDTNDRTSVVAFSGMKLDELA